jgi:plasmid stabilization system protein ParE
VNVRILPLARNDLSEGYWFYEERAVGLGDYFLSTLEDEIDDLAYQAGIHFKVLDFYFVKHSGCFPYSIYYYVSGDTVIVDAVIDQRRDPEWISDRLG